MDQKICPVCGANSSALAKFCYACGAELHCEEKKIPEIAQPAEAPVTNTTEQGTEQPAQADSGQLPPAGQTPPYPGSYQIPPQNQPYGVQPGNAQMPPQGTPYGQLYQQPTYPQAQPFVPLGYRQKSRTAAGILGILLGIFGAHNFYLGYTGRAIAQLLITILSGLILSPVSFIWGLVEGIRLLNGSVQTDGHRVPLSD